MLASIPRRFQQRENVAAHRDAQTAQRELLVAASVCHQWQSQGVPRRLQKVNGRPLRELCPHPLRGRLPSTPVARRSPAKCHQITRQTASPFRQFPSVLLHNLEQGFPEIVAAQPELLARHCTEAGLDEQAIRYWRAAGEKAVRRASNREAIGPFRQALALNEKKGPSVDRSLAELAILSQLGPALMSVHGWTAPEVGEAFERAEHLAREVESSADLAPPLAGLRVAYSADLGILPVNTDVRRVFGQAVAWFEELAGTRRGAFVLFLVALAVFAVQSIAIPVAGGRDFGSYVAYYVQMWDSRPAGRAKMWT